MHNGGNINEERVRVSCNIQYIITFSFEMWQIVAGDIDSYN